MIGIDPASARSVSVLSLGAMLMGTRTDEETSFAILDRYVAAGGTFIDTSGNYAFWVNGTQGGESEELLGRWRRSRGITDSDGIVIATKVGTPGLVLVAYSPLLSGAYVRADRPLGPSFSHAGTGARLSVLRSVAAETGATVNQVVLSWLMGGEIPVIPLVGASSVAQLEESLGAVDLELTAAQRELLDLAH